MKTSVNKFTGNYRQIVNVIGNYQQISPSIINDGHIG